MSENTIIISDLRAAQPQDAVLENYVPGKWFAVPYTSGDGIEGYMLMGDDEASTPPEISIELNVKGIYKVYLGIYYPHTRAASYRLGGEIWVKLTGDSAYSRIAREAVKGKNAPSSRHIHTSIYETYFTTDTLDNKSLHISVPGEPYKGGISGIAYIKLVKADDKHIEAVSKLKTTEETKRGIVMWCGGNMGGSTRGAHVYFPKNREWFKNELMPYKDTDVNTICAEIIRGNQCLFKTTEGDSGSYFEEGGYDALEGFSSVCREYGLKLWVAARFIGASYPIIKNDVHKARFYWENRELAVLDREGYPSNFTSFAYEKTQQHWLKIFEDALKYDIDGLCIYLNRAYPFVGYEKPVCDSFIEKYGVDPKTLPDDDSRWLSHIGSYMVDFMRKLKALADSYNKTLAVAIKSSITGDFPPDVPVKEIKGGDKAYYVDVDTMIKEKLVDSILITPKTFEHQIKRWSSLGDVKIYSDLMPRTQPGEDYARLMRKYYDMGVYGYCLWDGQNRPCRIGEWNVVKKLGHRDMLEYFEAEAPNYIKGSLMKLINGMSVDISFSHG